MLPGMGRRPAPRIPDGYDPRSFPPVAVTVDVVVVTLRERRLHVLLVERGGEPWQGAWALPGGFIRPDETLDEAAARELREETGVDASAHLEQLGAYGDPKRDPRLRVVTVAYLAVVPAGAAPQAGTDAARAEWVPVDDVTGPARTRELAFDHDLVLADALERLREKLSTTSLATAFVGLEFTLAELREVYEAAWGMSLDPANFRRKVLATQHFVVPTGMHGKVSAEGGKRPELYRSYGRARLHPPMVPPAQLDLLVSASEGIAPPRSAQRVSYARPVETTPLWAARMQGAAPERGRVWRCWIGSDAAFQRRLLQEGLLAPVARGDETIPDEDWDAFLKGMQAGDWVLAPIARGRVAVGEVRSAILDRPKQNDRRLRLVREVAWHAELPRTALEPELRERLEAPGYLTPIRVSGAARRIRRLLDER